jgi:hypothetical protein
MYNVSAESRTSLGDQAGLPLFWASDVASFVKIPGPIVIEGFYDRATS